MALAGRISYPRRDWRVSWVGHDTRPAITRLDSPFIVTLCACSFIVDWRVLSPTTKLRDLARARLRVVAEAGDWKPVQDSHALCLADYNRRCNVGRAASLVYGRYLFAVGRNEEASRYSGINSRRI